ncbi:hypothetical protein PQQ95_16645 [Paraburkholderia caffeinilytica]
MKNPAAAHSEYCIVCRQLVEADLRYLRRLQTDRQMRDALTDALVVSMGFCEHHWRNLQEADPDTAQWSSRCVSEASLRPGELFARTRLQDEFKMRWAVLNSGQSGSCHIALTAV